MSVCKCTSALRIHKRMQECQTAVRDDCIINSYSYSHREKGEQKNIKNVRLGMHVYVYDCVHIRDETLFVWLILQHGNTITYIQSHKQYFRINSRN